MSAELVISPKMRHLTVTDRTLEDLLSWVLSASAQEVTWNASEFREVRDWLKTQKAASDLRIKATRLELIALRKIGQAGLTKKLTNSQREASEWVCALTDDGFTELLNSVVVTDTPLGLKRRAGRDERDVFANLRYRSIQDGTPDRGFEDYAPYGLNNAIRQIVEELSTDGQSFTIADAADELSRRYAADEGGWDVPPEILGEPLREVVRYVVRHGSMKNEPLINADGDRVRVPEYVTYSEDETPGYARVAWGSAGIEQFRFMVAMKEQQAAEVVERFEQAKRLLDILDDVAESRPDLTKCLDLEQVARSRQLLTSEVQS